MDGGAGCPLKFIPRDVPCLNMKWEFAAIIEAAPEGGFWAIYPEVPGANGQGDSIEEATASLRDAIRLIFEDRLEDGRRGLPDSRPKFADCGGSAAAPCLITDRLWR